MGKALRTKTDDGGLMTIEQSGKGFKITVERGFKETPEERKARISMSRRGGMHQAGTRRERTRASQKRAAIRNSW